METAHECKEPVATVICATSLTTEGTALWFAKTGQATLVQPQHATIPAVDREQE